MLYNGPEHKNSGVELVHASTYCSKELGKIPKASLIELDAQLITFFLEDALDFADELEDRGLVGRRGEDRHRLVFTLGAAKRTVREHLACGC